jgi:hypothetical protein
MTSGEERPASAPPVERTSLRDTFQRAEGVLAAVNRLGIRLGRFSDYLDVLQQAAKTLTKPTNRPFLGTDARDRLFYEAASQTMQLVDSFAVWRWEDPEVVRPKLRRICSGAALPPKREGNPNKSGVSDDAPRNTLAELACAAILHRKGFGCRLTGAAEDVEATFGGLKPFAVEAKRPAHLKSLSDNAKAVRRQLGTRVRDGAKLGLAVFAADRMLGLADGDLVLDRADRLDAMLGKQVTQLVQRLQNPKHRLFPRASLGAVLTTGAVFCVDPGFLVTISSMGFFCTGPEDHPLSVQLYQALRGTMDQTHIMR